MESDKPQNQWSLPAVLSADIITENEFFYDLDILVNMKRMVEKTIIYSTVPFWSGLIFFKIHKEFTKT